MAYLQPHEYYEDLYDRGTVEQCRFLHHHRLEITDKDVEDANLSLAEAASIHEVKGLWIGVVQEMAAFFAAAERFNKKEAAIQEMMQDDKTKDHVMATAEPPANSHCRKCLGHDLRVIDKDLWAGDDGKYNRVLFMFKCNKCGTNSAFYDNGEEWIVKPTRCAECNTEKVTFTKDTKNDILTITYSCGRCDNVWKDIHDFTTKLKEHEAIDLTYHEDRKLYCYSKKVRSWAEDLKNNPVSHYSRPSWEENETEKLYKAELEKIEMLTVAQVSKRLATLLGENGYKDFQLGKPNMDKELLIPFTAIDEKDGRSADDSKRTIWKLLSRELEPSNWRLVKSSLDYRVGYVKGKLRAYEHRLELEKLIDQKLRKVH